MRRHPLRVDVIHPVIDLANRVIGITTAWPMAQRLRGRDAGLAWVDDAAVFGGEPRQVEHLDLEAARCFDDLLGDGDEAKGLRHLAGTSVLTAARSVHQQNARGRFWLFLLA